MVALDGKLFAIGGFAGSDRLSSVEVFDPARNTWELAGSMSTKRDYHSAVVVGESLFVIGEPILPPTEPRLASLRVGP